MRIVAIEQTHSTLADLVKQVVGGEEFTITENGQPKAKLCAVTPQKRAQAKAGSMPGKIWMSPDFDAPLDDFKAYIK